MQTESEVLLASQPFEVRLAVPADVDGLVELHAATFTPEEHLLILFGTAVLRPIYRWFVASSETFTVIATSGGAIVGLCTACSRPYNGPMIRSNWFALAVGIMRNPQVLFHPEIVKRMRKGFSALRSSAAPQTLDTTPPAQLGFLAVRKDFLGAQVGDALVRQAVDECCRRNWRRVRAGIYTKNLPARFMYAKLGFKENRALRTEQLVVVELNLET